MCVNWFSNFIIAFCFPYLQKLLTHYVFLVFAVIVGLALVIIIKKMPETKGCTIEEIMDEFEGKKKRNHESKKLMDNTKV